MSVWPVAIQTLTPLGIGIIGSSPAQNIEDPPQRVSINVLVNADTRAATEFDLDQAPAPPRRIAAGASVDETLSAAAGVS
jgi:hypothetical protein